MTSILWDGWCSIGGETCTRFSVDAEEARDGRCLMTMLMMCDA